MTWEQVGVTLFAIAIVCEQAHVVSPIILAWSHSGLRRIALSRPIETILLPAVAVVGALLASSVPCPAFAKPWLIGSMPSQLEALWLIWWVYWIWNIYHFGAQHYGVSRILGWRVPKWLCLGGTAILMVGGHLVIPGWWKWISLFAIDFQHWLVDIGLSSRISPLWWVFLPVIVALGCVGFLWKTAHSDHMATLIVPWIIQTRWGIGIVHFLYSRWIWKLSDPLVRAAIGQDLSRTKWQAKEIVA